MQLKASGKVTEFEFGKHYNTAENMFNFEALDQKGYYGMILSVRVGLFRFFFFVILSST